MELNRKQIIQFTNVNENEIFWYPLVLLKGYIIYNDANYSHWSEIITVDYLDKDDNIIKTVSNKLHNGKFMFLIDLQLGKNTFFFRFEGNKLEKIFFYSLSPEKHVVTPVYIICRDSTLAYDNANTDVQKFCNKISVGCRLIQTLIAETLFHYGYGRRTFLLEQLPNNSNENANCLLFFSKLKTYEAADMTPEELWEYFGREIMTSEYGSEYRKYLAFFSCNNISSKRLVIGGGGLALCAAEYFQTWPVSVDNIGECFSCNERMDSVFSNDHMNNTFENCFGASLGAVCHELCHTFDLGHTIDGIMGKDYDLVASMLDFFEHDVHQRTNKSKNFSVTNKNDSLIIWENNFNRKLKISYSVDKSSYFMNINECSSKCNHSGIDKSQKMKHNELFPQTMLWNNGCVALLAYHRWINHKHKIDDEFNEDVETILKYDYTRSTVTSKYGVVVVQLRNQYGYVLKSWQFCEKRNKTLFLVPICEARHAYMIVVEDLKGNLLKKNVKDLFSNYNTDVN